MTFEEALKYELTQIESLGQKVYSIFAPKGLQGPFLVYRKESVKFKKTFGGTSNKAEGIYGIVILANNDSVLQQVAEDVKNKFLSFQSSVIGTEGPLIENVTVEFMGDEYDPEAEMLRSNIKIQVNY